MLILPQKIEYSTIYMCDTTQLPGDQQLSRSLEDKEIKSPMAYCIVENFEGEIFCGLVTSNVFVFNSCSGKWSHLDLDLTLIPAVCEMSCD